MRRLIDLLFLLFVILILGAFAHAGSVSLVWDPSPSEGVIGYRVHFGNESRIYDSFRTIPNQTSYTVSDLLPGLYYFAVTALDAADNESGYSNEVSAIVEAPVLYANCPSMTIGTAGIAFSAQILASGGQAPYSYSLVNGALPEGIVLGSETGLLSGIPVNAGDFPYSIRVTDAYGTTEDIDCTLKIELAPPQNLEITSMSASKRWFGVVLLATTNVDSKAIFRYTKLGGDNWITVIATPEPIKTQHRVVLYIEPGDTPVYYKYEWTVTDVDNRVVMGSSTFQI